jgi:hypothetical protein
MGGEKERRRTRVMESMSQKEINREREKDER